MECVSHENPLYYSKTIVANRFKSAVHNVLEPGGRFVAYQMRDRVEALGREVFGRARVQTELFNVPPMRVYRWDK